MGVRLIFPLPFVFHMIHVEKLKIHVLYDFVRKKVFSGAHEDYSIESSSTDAIVDTKVETTLATTPNIITKRPPPSKKNISASIVYFLSHL